MTPISLCLHEEFILILEKVSATPRPYLDLANIFNRYSQEDIQRNYDTTRLCAIPKYALDLYLHWRIRISSKLSDLEELVNSHLEVSFRLAQVLAHAYCLKNTPWILTTLRGLEGWSSLMSFLAYFDLIPFLCLEVVNKLEMKQPDGIVGFASFFSIRFTGATDTLLRKRCPDRSSGSTKLSSLPSHFLIRELLQFNVRR